MESMESGSDKEIKSSASILEQVLFIPDQGCLQKSYTGIFNSFREIINLLL